MRNAQVSQMRIADDQEVMTDIACGIKPGLASNEIGQGDSYSETLDLRPGERYTIGGCAELRDKILDGQAVNWYPPKKENTL